MILSTIESRKVSCQKPFDRENPRGDESFANTEPIRLDRHRRLSINTGFKGLVIGDGRGPKEGD
jgi:hypothetical protein